MKYFIRTILFYILLVALLLLGLHLYLKTVDNSTKQLNWKEAKQLENSRKQLIENESEELKNAYYNEFNEFKNQKIKSLEKLDNTEKNDRVSFLFGPHISDKELRTQYDKYYNKKYNDKISKIEKLSKIKDVSYFSPLEEAKSKAIALRIIGFLIITFSFFIIIIIHLYKTKWFNIKKMQIIIGSLACILIFFTTYFPIINNKSLKITSIIVLISVPLIIAGWLIYLLEQMKKGQ